MPLTTRERNRIFNAVLRNTAYVLDADHYLALFLTEPADDGSGTEVSAGGIARQSVTIGAPTNGIGANTNAIAFAPVGADFGLVVAVALFDALSSGNMIWSRKFQYPIYIGVGSELRFDIGDLEFQIL